MVFPFTFQVPQKTLASTVLVKSICLEKRGEWVSDVQTATSADRPDQLVYNHKKSSHVKSYLFVMCLSTQFCVMCCTAALSNERPAQQPTTTHTHTHTHTSENEALQNHQKGSPFYSPSSNSLYTPPDSKPPLLSLLLARILSSNMGWIVECTRKQ